MRLRLTNGHHRNLGMAILYLQAAFVGEKNVRVTAHTVGRVCFLIASWILGMTGENPRTIRAGHSASVRWDERGTLIKFTHCIPEMTACLLCVSYVTVTVDPLLFKKVKKSFTDVRKPNK